MIVLVTGGSGQLGKAVIEELNNRNHTVLAPSSTELDIVDKNSVQKYFANNKFDAIIHCAAYTKVDDAELAENYVRVFDVNGVGTKNLVDNTNAKFVYISTDYVFKGDGDEPWKPNDITIPLNNYGRSKLSGEYSLENYPRKYIVRISWLFGDGKNFVNTMLSLKDKESINVVNDQIGRPTYTKDLSRLLVDMVESDKYGTYNVSNEGQYISWYDFAKEIFNQKRITTKVNPVSSSDYPTKAERPKNSRLDTSKLTENGFKLLPDWKDALGRYLNG